MTNKLLVSACAISIAALAGCASIGAGRKAQGPTLLVIPARPSVVKFAFDAASLRPMYLVSYDRDKAGAPFLNLWNPEQRQWSRLTVDEYKSGNLFTVPPARALVFGPETMTPAELGGIAAVCADVTREPGLDRLAMANALNAKLNFTVGEWRTLSERNQLELKDQNTDRRRWGKYGPPGQKAKPAVKEAALDAEPIAPPAPVEKDEAAALAPAPEKKAPVPAPAPAAQQPADK
jgi:hypothetical protein